MKILFKNKVGFTLPEAIVVILVLGIVAMLVIPPAVRRHREAINRAKIKKTMTVYDTLLAKMVVENDLRSEQAFQVWANADCQNTSKYFKVSQYSTKEENKNSYCKFKTTDNVWWDISDILSPNVALDENDLGKKDGKTSFSFMSHFDDNGSIRINDLVFELSRKNITSEEKDNIQKLYAFLSGKAVIAAAKKIEYLHYIDETYDYMGQIYDYTYYIDENGNKIMTSRTSSPDAAGKTEVVRVDGDYFDVYHCDADGVSNCVLTLSYYWKNDENNYCNETSENICRRRAGNFRVQASTGHDQPDGTTLWDLVWYRNDASNTKEKSIEYEYGNKNKPIISEYNTSGKLVNKKSYEDYENNVYRERVNTYTGNVLTNSVNYDTDGDKLNETKYDETTGKRTYYANYNAKGQLSNETTYSKENGTTKTSYTKYVIIESAFVANTKTTTEYAANGTTATKKTIWNYGSDTTLTDIKKITEYTYDTDGTTVLKTCTTVPGNEPVCK